MARGYRLIYDKPVKSAHYRAYIHLMDPNIYPHYLMTGYNQLIGGSYITQKKKWEVTITDIKADTAISDQSGWIDLPKTAIVNIPFEARMQGLSDDKFVVEWFSTSFGNAKKIKEVENGRASQWTGTVPGIALIGAKVYADKEKKKLISKKEPKQVEIIPAPKIEIFTKGFTTSDLTIDLDNPDFGKPLPLQARLITMSGNKAVTVDIEKINLLPEWHGQDDRGNNVMIERDIDLLSPDLKNGLFRATFSPPSCDRTFSVWASLKGADGRGAGINQKDQDHLFEPLVGVEIRGED